jgi:dTDP-4-amino-4,6-dideoxygalactose transaminase
MNNIPVLRPTYDEQTKRELLEVLDSGWTGYGPKTMEFENKFAEYVKAKYAVATNSATSALDLCLKVYGITGGELITPAMTFVSDAIVGEWNGMDVTFADVNPRTLCIDPESIVITENTKAIIAVDCHGRLADIDGIRRKIADAGRSDILVIEDAAHAMYTPGVGKGDIVVYSFQAVKTLPIFDGGMITTEDEEIAKKLKKLTWLGIEKSTFDRAQGKGYSWEYDITQADGIKAYMTDVQAVIGLGQLRRLENMTGRRRTIQARYDQAFDGNLWFTKPEWSHTVQYYTPEWKDRNGLCGFLAENGISTGVHFKPLSELTYWKKAKKNPLPNTDEVWLNLLSLPCHSALTDKEQEFIITKVKEYYA